MRRAVSSISKVAMRSAPRSLLAASTLRSASTLGDAISRVAAEHPKREVLRVPHQEITWSAGDFETQTNALAAGLLEIGYKRGTTLAVWIGNETEHLCAVVAAARVGCVVVDIDPEASVSDVAGVLKAENCRGLMFGQRYNGEHRGKQMSEITDLENWHWGDMVQDKNYRSLRHLINTGHEDLDGVMQYKHFPVYDPMPNPLPMVAGSIDSDSPLVIPYSATESGVVRGTPVSQNDLLKSAGAAAKAMGLAKEDVVCVAAGQHTAFGLAGSLAALTVGSKVILPSRELDGDAAFEAASEYGATALVSSEAVLGGTTKSFDASKLRTGLLDDIEGGQARFSKFASSQ